MVSNRFPFKNYNFNILAGDIFDEKIFENEIRGIGVLGNHDIHTLFINNLNQFQEYENEEWYKILLSENWDLSSIYFPYNDLEIINKFKKLFSLHFPNIKLIDNESLIYNGIKYIGIFNPWCILKNKNKYDELFINILKNELTKNNNLPTVIISHAPLFNEISLLNKNSKSYKKEYFCTIYDKFSKLISKNNVLGFIRGHLHIPAFSSGWEKYIKIKNKKLFIICSIYSRLNSGIDLSLCIENIKNK